jgi:DNA-binding IclR family transcriptional regulator
MHFGLVQQDEKTKKYLWGRTCALLGMAAEGSQTDRLTELSRPHIEHLRDAVGESVCLEIILSGRNKVIVEAIGPPPLSVSFMEFLPLHVTSGAKVILAYTDPKLSIA